MISVPEYGANPAAKYDVVQVGPESQPEWEAQEAQDGAQSGAHSDKILIILSGSEVSAGDLLLDLGLKSKTGSFKRALQELLNAKLIEYTQPDKPKSRLQKYRLTKKGKKMLDDLKK